MTKIKRIVFSLIIICSFFTFAASTIIAKDKDFDSLVRHLQKNYQAKKVKIPFMWLARFAVKVVRPAGVKSFNVTLFENLKLTQTVLDNELKQSMQNSLSADWSPILRVRSRDGEQVYAYMRESGNDVKLMLVTIDKDQAAIIRATFNPDKLAEFIENPKIFGISLNDDDNVAKNNKKETLKETLLEEKEDTDKN